jgi:farnesyl-diphosphate farnesyltransferase
MVSAADLRYQHDLLSRVSRTFALTIPQLPPELREVVANAYLVCRLADTIEDDPGLGSREKARFMAALLAVLGGKQSAEAFARRLGARMSPAMSASEHELVRNTPTILRITDSFSERQRHAVVRCVSAMGQGMPEFQRHKSLDGLASLQEMERYCYFVAGVVGEMLTELFCDHCPGLAPHRDSMMGLAVRFGQGLQMTNILKDVWEDRAAETCWLPRSLFGDLKGGLGRALRRHDAGALADGISTLVAITRTHLEAALRYTQMIPKSEPGMRRFCLWAIGMAVLTLRKIHRNPGFTSARQVKISRRTVKATALACNLALHSNRALQLLFATATYGLPHPHVADRWSPGADLAPDGPN